MVTVEADTVAGPLLAELAERNGVTYSLAYGDQPALIVELVDWARTAGFEVVAAGKGNAAPPDYRHGTPDDVFERLGFDDAFVEARDLNARMYNSFVDGTKVAVEMGAVANATGFAPDVPGMHLPTAGIPELPELFRPEADGGLLDGTGVVDTVRTTRADGSSVEGAGSISSGVFVVVTTSDDRARGYLDEYAGRGFHAASAGRYAVFYRPYHLPGLETAVSVANAAIRNEATGAPRARHAEVVGAAKRDLEPGDELDGGGGDTVYGRLVDADDADASGYVPFELLDGATVVRPVETDAVVTADHVELDRDSFLYRLRAVADGR